MAGRIFISYRRGADNNSAGRIYDALVDKFGENRVFMDVDTIPPGVDFVDYIDKTVGDCDAFLAVIGPGWHDEKARLHRDGDFVHLEIHAALKRDNIRIVPLLVSGAEMPAEDDLPRDLHPLLRRSGLKISHDTFSATLERLSESLAVVLSPGPSLGSGHPGTGDGTISRTGTGDGRVRRPIWPWLAGAAAVLSTAGGIAFVSGALNPVIESDLFPRIWGPETSERPKQEPIAAVEDPATPQPDPGETDAKDPVPTAPNDGETSTDRERFSLVLLDSGPEPDTIADKLQAWTGVALQELKLQVNRSPQTILTGASDADARRARKTLAGIGATAIILPYSGVATRYYSVRIDARDVPASDRDAMLDKLSELTGLDRDKLAAALRTPHGTVWVGPDREEGRALVGKLDSAGIPNGQVILLAPRTQPPKR